MGVLPPHKYGEFKYRDAVLSRSDFLLDFNWKGPSNLCPRNLHAPILLPNNRHANLFSDVSI